MTGGISSCCTVAGTSAVVSAVVSVIIGLSAATGTGFVTKCTNGLS